MKDDKPWEFYAVELMYPKQQQSVTMTLVPRTIDRNAKDLVMQAGITKVDENGDVPFAIFAVPVTLH